VIIFRETFRAKNCEKFCNDGCDFVVGVERVSSHVRQITLLRLGHCSAGIHTGLSDWSHLFRLFICLFLYSHTYSFISLLASDRAVHTIELASKTVRTIQVKLKLFRFSFVSVSVQFCFNCADSIREKHIKWSRLTLLQSVTPTCADQEDSMQTSF